MTVPKTGVLPLHHGSIRGTKIVFSPKNQSFSDAKKAEGQKGFKRLKRPKKQKDINVP